MFISKFKILPCKRNKYIFKILLSLFLCLYIYYLIIGLGFGPHEGLWEIFYKITTATILIPVIFLIGYSIFSQIKQSNKTRWENFISISILIIFVGLMFYLEIFLLKKAYHAVFESQKMVITHEYTTRIKKYRGTHEYYLYFDDDQHPNICDSSHQKCKYTYKVRINKTTYQKLEQSSHHSKEVSLKLLHKPKAEILMDWEILK